METKIINGVQCIVYSAGMLMNDPEKSYYVEDDLNCEDDLYCKGDLNCEGNLYCKGNLYCEGDLYCKGNLNCKGNLYCEGDLYCKGNLNCEGDMDVRYIYLRLYCKWAFRIDRDSDNIKIGCVKKTESEWIKFFEKKEKIETDPNSRQYMLIESAFNVARQMNRHLLLMNQKEQSEQHHAGIIASGGLTNPPNEVSL